MTMGAQAHWLWLATGSHVHHKSRVGASLSLPNPGVRHPEHVANTDATAQESDNSYKTEAETSTL